MKIKTIEAPASEIVEKYGQDDFEDTVDRLTFKNSILVYIINQSGNIIYNSDEHGSGGKPDGLGGKKIHVPCPKITMIF